MESQTPVDFLNAVKATLKEESHSAQEIGDWLEEINADLTSVLNCEGEVPTEVFLAEVEIIKPVPYGLAEDADGNEVVDTAAPAIEATMDYLGLINSHTVADLITALESETEGWG